jgi:hypothetical protein
MKLDVIDVDDAVEAVEAVVRAELLVVDEDEKEERSRLFMDRERMGRWSGDTYQRGSSPDKVEANFKRSSCASGDELLPSVICWPQVILSNMSEITQTLHQPRQARTERHFVALILFRNAFRIIS